MSTITCCIHVDSSIFCKCLFQHSSHGDVMYTPVHKKGVHGIFFQSDSILHHIISYRCETCCVKTYKNLLICCSRASTLISITDVVVLNKTLKAAAAATFLFLFFSKYSYLAHCVLRAKDQLLQNAAPPPPHSLCVFCTEALEAR